MGSDPYLWSHAHGGQRYALTTSEVVASEDAIDEMNSEFALVTTGQAALIARSTVFGSKNEIEFLQLRAFSALMLNRLSPDPKRNLGAYWLRSPRRREYRGVEFKPNGGRADYLNLFTGFAVKPKSGTAGRFWEFLREVICNNNDEAYKYVRRWLAHIFQRPEELPGTALVLRGKQGTGKGTFVDTIGKLIGDHYIELHSMDQVTGRFNGHLKNALLAYANEAIWGGSKSQVGMLKGMITDKLRSVEQKGVDIFKVDNFLRLIVSSNESWAVPADADDRRFVFLNVSDAHAGDFPYFKSIRDELAAGGYEALMHDLASEDLSGFIPMQRPKTGFGFDVKLASAEPIIRWLHDVLDLGGFETQYGFREWKETMEKREVYEAYCDYHRRIESKKPEAEATFHKRFKEILGTLREERPRAKVPSPGTSADKRAPRTYVLHALAATRKTFEKYMHVEGEVKWAAIVRARHDEEGTGKVQVVQLHPTRIVSRKR
jgi:hypothetical protein